MKIIVKNGKVKIIPLFPKSISLAADEITKATAGPSGGPNSSKSAFFKRLDSLLAPYLPCKVSILATDYEYNNVVYKPSYRLTANNAFLVGKYGSDVGQCNNILVPEGAQNVSFSVEWKDDNKVSISTGTENDDILDLLYNDGDIIIELEAPN